MGAAFVLGYLLAHPGLLVAWVATSAVATVAVLYYAIDDGSEPKARHKKSRRERRREQDAATEAWVTGLHDEDGEPWYASDAPGFLPAPPPDGPPRVDPAPEPVAAHPAAAESGPPALPPPPVTLPWQRFSALAVLHALTAPVRQHVEAAGQAKREELQAEALAAFPEWKPWPGDTTLTNMRAIKAGG